MDNDLLNFMRSFASKTTPQVGIFWYEPKSGQLIGIYKQDYDAAPQWESGLATIPVLHKNKWKPLMEKYGQMDYTLVPRGRIFYNHNTELFTVKTDDRIGEYPDEVKTLILEEFNLPDTTKFEQDEHWDIGHGWSI